MKTQTDLPGERELYAAGFVVVEVSPALFFVADPLDDADGYSISGPDAAALIAEACSHLELTDDGAKREKGAQS